MSRLTDPDPAVRRVALLEAIDDGDHQAAIAAADDPSPDVRLEAVRALEGLGEDEAVGVLLDRLADSDADVRVAAESALAELRDAGPARLLIARWPAPTSGGRAALLAGLRNLRLPASVPIARQGLQDGATHVRLEAVLVLAYLNDPRLAADLLPLAQDADPTIRRATVAALTGAGDPAVERTLLAALTDGAWEVREAAAGSLGRQRPEVAVDGLIGCLRSDASWQVRVQAATALGIQRDTRAVPALGEALGHAISNLRKTAASALVALGSVQALPFLRRALEDPDIEVRKIAARGIAALER